MPPAPSSSTEWRDTSGSKRSLSATWPPTRPGLDDAIREYLAAIHLDSGHAKAYANLGSAYYERRNINLAVEMLTKSLEIDPDQPRIEALLKEWRR